MNSTVNLRRSGRAGLGAAAQRATAEAAGARGCLPMEWAAGVPQGAGPAGPDAEDSEHGTAGDDGGAAGGGRRWAHR